MRSVRRILFRYCETDAEREGWHVSESIIPVSGELTRYCVVKFDTISRLIVILTFQVIGKQQIFQGLAEFYQSLVCKASKDIGEEIARLQAAISYIKAGQQSSAKNLYQDYLAKAQRALIEAEKDNNFIYHEAVPDIKTLNPISKAAVAKPTPLPSRLSSNFQGWYAAV